MKIKGWDHYYMSVAALTAQKSKDPSSQIGACIIKDQRIISTGYNGFPQGVIQIDEHVLDVKAIQAREERPEKYFWYEHGERNAIYSAARLGVSTKGGVMYCACHIPCCDCARGIIQAGLQEIFYLELENTAKWDEHGKRSAQMFDEAGVKYTRYDGPELGFEILRSGKLITI